MSEELIVCIECGEAFGYKGRGRKPKRCEQCRIEHKRNYDSVYLITWTIDNPEYFKEYRKEWRISNKTKDRKNNRKHCKNYYKNHSSKLKIRNKQYRKDNKDYWKNWHKRFRKIITVNGKKIVVTRYHFWRYHKKKKEREYQRNYQQWWREQPENKEYMRKYHKRHREKYHRGTDMGTKLRRDKYGRPDFEAERKVIENEFKRINLKQPSKHETM